MRRRMSRDKKRAGTASLAFRWNRPESQLRKEQLRLQMSENVTSRSSATANGIGQCSSNYGLEVRFARKAMVIPSLYYRLANDRLDIVISLV